MNSIFAGCRISHYKYEKPFVRQTHLNIVHRYNQSAGTSLDVSLAQVGSQDVVPDTYKTVFGVFVQAQPW